MDLKDRVCSWELAKRLCELGEPQDSLWWWVDDGVQGWVLLYEPNINNATRKIVSYSAFTVAELGERIPVLFINRLRKSRFGGEWRYYRREIDLPHGLNEVNARAKLQIYLLENKLQRGEK